MLAISPSLADIVYSNIGLGCIAAPVIASLAERKIPEGYIKTAAKIMQITPFLFLFPASLFVIPILRCFHMIASDFQLPKILQTITDIENAILYIAKISNVALSIFGTIISIKYLYVPYGMVNGATMLTAYSLLSVISSAVLLSKCCRQLKSMLH